MENMKSFIEIFSYVITGLSILVSLIITFLTSRKTKRRNSENEELEYEIEEQEATITSLETLNSSLEKMEKLIAYIPKAMEQSETSGITSGIAKKLYALSLIMLKCSELGIDYQANSNELSNKIEELIDFSKEVNYNKEVKEEI